MNKEEYNNIYRQESSYWWYKTLHHLVEKQLRKLPKDGNKQLLDAGCGTGRMLEIMQQYGQVEGIDFSEDAIAFTKERGLPNAQVGDLNTHRFIPERFDVITSLDVLYHTGIKSDAKVLHEFYSALKPGGKLILNLAAFESLRRAHDEVVHTRKRYHKSETVELLQSIGFSIEIATYRMPHLYAAIRLKKLFEKKHTEAQSDLQELPRSVNQLLFRFGQFENAVIQSKISLPVGSSLFIIATKN